MNLFQQQKQYQQVPSIIEIDEIRTEEDLCIKELKNKRTCEQQKSKRNAFIGMMREKVFEENKISNDCEDLFRDKRSLEEEISDKKESNALKGKRMNIFENSSSNYSNINQNFQEEDDLFETSGGINENTKSGSQFYGKQDERIVQQIISQIEQAYQKNDNLTSKEIRDLKSSLTQLSNQTVNIKSNGEILRQNDNLISLMEGLLYIIREREKFTMDIKYESISILANISGIESLDSVIVQFFLNRTELIISFITSSSQLMNFNQSTALLSKVILLIGNLCLESIEFSKVMANSSNFLNVIQNIILYIYDSALVAETLWMIGVLHKKIKFQFNNSQFSKNIAFILFKFKLQPQVIYELLMYLIQISTDSDSSFYNLYYDELVLTRILSILITQQHDGNSIACLSLLSNVTALLNPHNLAILLGLQVFEKKAKINTNEKETHCEYYQHEVAVQQEEEFYITKFDKNNKNGRSALLTAISITLKSRIIEIQRETLVFLSNIAVIFPIFLAQTPELVEALIQLFQNGNEELFKDLCYLFSNLIFQFPQSQQLFKQHPSLPLLLNTILNNEQIQRTYSSQLGSVFQHFQTFLQRI